MLYRLYGKLVTCIRVASNPKSDASPRWLIYLMMLWILARLRQTFLKFGPLYGSIDTLIHSHYKIRLSLRDMTLKVKWDSLVPRPLMPLLDFLQAIAFRLIHEQNNHYRCDETASGEEVVCAKRGLVKQHRCNEGDDIVSSLSNKLVHITTQSLELHPPSLNFARDSKHCFSSVLAYSQQPKFGSQWPR